MRVGSLFCFVAPNELNSSNLINDKDDDVVESESCCSTNLSLMLLLKEFLGMMLNSD